MAVTDKETGPGEVPFTVCFIKNILALMNPVGASHFANILGFQYAKSEHHTCVF